MAAETLSKPPRSAPAERVKQMEKDTNIFVSHVLQFLPMSYRRPQEQKQLKNNF